MDKVNFYLITKPIDDFKNRMPPSSSIGIGIKIRSFHISSSEFTTVTVEGGYRGFAVFVDAADVHSGFGIIATDNSGIMNFHKVSTGNFFSSITIDITNAYKYKCKCTNVGGAYVYLVTINGTVVSIQ